MYVHTCCRSQVRISLSTKNGYGFYIGHDICMVMGKGTIIGNNVNLSQFLNIGTNYGTPAIIDNNVYIGPNVCNVEDVKIGCNASIGAGAVITKDIPENATAAGVPINVLYYNNPDRFVKNQYPVEVSK
ncbi:MAG: acetyltransferase [Paludibacteraceae bacterium]|nr:acetyltransferase [Paludibacteraceae bacterium]